MASPEQDLFNRLDASIENVAELRKCCDWWQGTCAWWSNACKQAWADRDYLAARVKFLEAELVKERGYL